MKPVRALMCFLPMVPAILTGCATTTAGGKAVDEYVEVQSSTGWKTEEPARSPRERLEQDPAYKNLGPAMAIGMGAPKGEASGAGFAVKLWQLMGR